MPSRKAIDEFLAQKRIAVVGVCRNTKEFPNTVFRKLKETGHEVFPVNPHAEQLEGQPCYASVKALPGPVDGVVVMLPPDKSVGVVRECQEAGIPRVWLYRDSKEAASLAREGGVQVVASACPHMFMGGGFPHNIHRWFTRIDP